MAYLDLYRAKCCAKIVKKIEANSNISFDLQNDGKGGREQKRG